MLPAGFMRVRKESSASVATQTTQSTTSKPNRAKSPTFSTTTAASDMPLSPGVVITRADLRANIKAYEELVGALASYRNALTTVSNASAKVARALENCARLKGLSDDAACGLQAAGGLHHVIANHEQVLGRSLQVNCEQPLRQHLDAYKGAVSERSAAYERTLVEKSRVIRQTEKENLNLGRKRHRDLNSFRKTLAILQAQVDDLDRLKADYYESVLSHEEQVWDFVLGKVSYSVRATLDVYDRVTTKASDSNLESMLLSVPDPFDTYGPQKSEEQIFSILPPLALSMTSTSSPAPSSIPLHPHSHSIAPLSAPPITSGGSVDNLLTPSASPASSVSPPSPPFIGQSSTSMLSWLHPFQGSSAAATFVSGSAEWAESPSTSYSPQTLAGPPSSTTPPRRLTYPFTTTGPRASTPPKTGSRAESKLRTVLSATSEDETSASEQSSRDAEADGEADDSDDDTGTEVNYGAVSPKQHPNIPRRSTPESRRQDNASEETAIWRRSKTPVKDEPPANASQLSSIAS